MMGTIAPVHKMIVNENGSEGIVCELRESEPGMVATTWTGVTCPKCRGDGLRELRRLAQDSRRMRWNQRLTCYECGGYVQSLDDQVLLEYIPEFRRNSIITKFHKPLTLISECHCSVWHMREDETEWVRVSFIPFHLRVGHVHVDRLVEDLDRLLPPLNNLMSKETHRHIIGHDDSGVQAMHFKTFENEYAVISMKILREGEYYGVISFECRQEECGGKLVDRHFVEVSADCRTEHIDKEVLLSNG